MTYYVINKNTNQINPNLITNEVALFETEQDFINAMQQWIIDNTIINELSAFDENGAFIEIAPNNSVLQQNLATLPLEYETIDDAENIKPAPNGYKINDDETFYIELPNSTNTKYIQTIMPNLSDYQYRFANDIEIKQHLDDYLNYKINNATETTIVTTYKYNPNIENTSRQPMINYIIGEHEKEFNNFDHMYIEATGDLLNEFLTTKELKE